MTQQHTGTNKTHEPKRTRRTAAAAINLEKVLAPGWLAPIFGNHNLPTFTPFRSADSCWFRLETICDIGTRVADRKGHRCAYHEVADICAPSRGNVSGLALSTKRLSNTTADYCEDCESNSEEGEEEMVSYNAMGGASGGSSDTSRGRRRRSSRAMKDANFAGQASWISSNVNLVNTIIGAGTLAIPLALSHMGILLGTIVIIWSGCMAAFGLYLQTQCARYLERGTSSFFALSQLTYPNAAVVFDAAIAIKCFGVGVSYLIIIGDLMPGVVRGFNEAADSIPFLVDKHFWITVFMLVVIPLSFLRRLDSLKYTSIIALISIGYLVILVVYHFLRGDTMADRGPIRVIQWAGIIPTLQSFPVIVFAYTCHQNMFSILNEIKDNSHRNTTSVVAASIGSAASIYVLVGITGYLSFGDSVLGNIVGMYVPSTASTIAKAAIVVLVMFSYPLQVHPCRASVDAVLKWRPNGLKSAKTSPNGSPARSAPLLGGAPAQPSSRNDTISDLRFAIITTGIIILSYTAALTVSSLDKVLAYVGSTGSTSISFILPGLFYHKISAPESIHHQRLTKEDDEAESGDEDEEVFGEGASRSTWRRTLLRKASLGLACYGLFVMILCLSTNLFFSEQGH